MWTKISRAVATGGLLPVLLVWTNAIQAADETGGEILGVDRSGITLAEITDTTALAATLGGTTYDLSSAAISRDGIPDDAPAAGEVAVVTGVLDVETELGIADTFEIDTALRGPVVAINAAAGELRVLGRTAMIDAGTILAGLQDLNSIAPGDVVAASGYWDAGGDLRATRLSTESPEATRLSEGYVAELDLDSATFALGDLTVLFGNAVLSGFENGFPAEGDFVEVLAAGRGTGMALAADAVSLDQPFVGEAGLYLEVEGLVSGVIGTDRFTVGQVMIITTPGTEFVGGTATDIAPDVLLEVEGEIDALGVLVASEISFGGSDSLIAAPLQALVGGANKRLVILGKTFRMAPNIALIDDSDAAQEPFSLADLNAGDFVRVQLDTPPGTPPFATRLVRENPRPGVVLNGVASDINRQARRCKIHGITVVGAGLDATEFFNELRAGDVVEIEGRQISAGVVLASALARH